MKEFDFSSISLRNLKNYLYNVSSATEMFTISINGEEFDLPVEIATCYSNKIFENLSLDPTLRRMDFQIKFTNQNMSQKIINALTDQNQTNTKIEIESDTEIMDLLLFGKAIGYDSISTLINDYISSKIQNGTYLDASTTRPIALAMSRFTPRTLTVSSPKIPNSLPSVLSATICSNFSSLSPEATASAGI